MRSSNVTSRFLLVQRIKDSSLLLLEIREMERSNKEIHSIADILLQKLIPFISRRCGKLSSDSLRVRIRECEEWKSSKNLIVGPNESAETDDNDD